MNEFELMRNQAENQLKLIDQMSEMREAVENIDGRVEYLEKTIPLNRGEAFDIKHKVQLKVEELATRYFGRPVSKELWGRKKTHLSQGIHYLLKRRFNSVSYTTILHVDFEKAIEYIQSLGLDNLPPHYLRLTDKQFEVNVKNKDGFTENFRGAHIQSLFEGVS